MKPKGSLRIVLQLDGFFKVPLQQIKVEVGPVTGLTYFTHKGRTLAIGEPTGGKVLQ